MSAPVTAGSVPDSTYVDVAEVPWQPTRFPGVEWKILMEQKETGLSTVLMRWAPGARLPAHEHVAIEQTYVLEGSFADHAGVCLRLANLVHHRLRMGDATGRQRRLRAAIVVDQHPGASCREQQRMCPTHAAPGPGDDGHAAVQPNHSVLLLRHHC